MCTLLILHRSHPAAPVCIAANRDEFYARPSTPPQRLREHPNVLGGRDLHAGGTWMGVNEGGLFVGLTNIYQPETAAQSRGCLVLEALGQHDPAAVERLINERVQPGAYRAFNLLYGNSESLHLSRFDEGALSHQSIPPGIHVLPSTGTLDDHEQPKVSRGLELLQRAQTEPTTEGLVGALKTALRDHREPPLDAIPERLTRLPGGDAIAQKLQSLCVHTHVYGTRSCTIALLGADRLEYHFSDGPACQAQWARYEHLLTG